MKEQELKFLLGEITREAFPDIPHPWPAFQSRMQANENKLPQRGFMMKTSKITTKTYPLAARVALIVALALLFVGAVFLITPQGRALAEEILHFFNRAPSDTLPLQSWQLTPLPTLGLNTPTPDPASIIDANQTVQAVEKQAGFHVLEPAYLPKILSFSGASYDPEHHIARIFYRYVDTNGLALSEDPYQIKANCDLCDVVGASAAVETVQIGEVTSEYAEGAWNLTDNGPVWMDDPYLKRMRWKANGIAFELLYMGPPDSVTKEDMIAIAESLK